MPVDMLGFPLIRPNYVKSDGDEKRAAAQMMQLIGGGTDAVKIYPLTAQLDYEDGCRLRTATAIIVDPAGESSFVWIVEIDGGHQLGRVRDVMPADTVRLS